MWNNFFPQSLDHVYPVSHLTEFISEIRGDYKEIINNGTTYLNIPCAFDIEASSWSTGTYEEDNVQHWACMYIWQFGINGSVIYGRTWQEFHDTLAAVGTALKLSKKRRIIIYVHNLGYEFQWIRRQFEWQKVFAIKNRRPVYATLPEAFDFRCSYFLSNYSLAYIGDSLLTKYKIRKLVGQLDYSKVRHSSTPLTTAELEYCVNDVKVLMSYIQEKIESDGDILQIPLTNTGYVRNYCRAACFTESCEDEEEKRKILLNYKSIMKSLKISSGEEYHQLKRAFMGGFTHASVLYSGQVMEEVGSADLTSSYPYTMVSQYFPMTPFKYIGVIIDADDLKYYLKHYCCLFDVQFTNITTKVEFENIISHSRCWDSEEVKLNNGRVVSAKTLNTTLTELDFANIVKFYSWESIKVVNFRYAHRGYLPKSLINAVLDLYEAKTSLKGVIGKEIEYLVSKGMINAAFGMMVTDIVRGEYAYDNEEGWLLFEEDVDRQLTKYNKNFNRFLYYAWGVWVTAHARDNLFSAIYEFGPDYVYSDTDSIKGINFANHQQYFTDYNNRVRDSLIKMCASLNIPLSKTRPKTKKGVAKIIGVWEFECDDAGVAKGYDKTFITYEFFKAIGAKRYMYVLPDGHLQITCAGVRKQYAVPYLLWVAGGGNLEANENFALEYLNSHSIHQDPHFTPFINFARFAYAASEPDNLEAMKALVSLNLNYEACFYMFANGMFIPPQHTGKQLVDYLDNGFTTICTDYLGIPAIVSETSAVYMEPQEYVLSITKEYRDLIKGVQHVCD